VGRLRLCRGRGRVKDEGGVMQLTRQLLHGFDDPKNKGKLCGKFGIQRRRKRCNARITDGFQVRDGSTNSLLSCKEPSCIKKRSLSGKKGCLGGGGDGWSPETQ